MSVNIALIQGLYFLITGIWPLLGIRTFMAATGPKVDIWPVKTVGLLLAVIGAGLVVASREESFADSTIVMAIGSAAAMAIIDVVYVAKGVIRKIYLADAAVEVVLIIWWLIEIAAR